MFNLRGKHALILGVASEESIAWAVARRLHQAGASISLGYQHRFKSRVLQLVKSAQVPVAFCERCDVTEVGELSAFFEAVTAPVDVVVHSVAYAGPRTFSRPITKVTKEEFLTALVTSSYSLLPVTRAVQPKMPKGGSVITMSYLGGQRVVANYRLMGIAKAALEAVVRELAACLGPEKIRVNAVSAGPVKTLAASHIAGFSQVLDRYERMAPLRRNINQDDVANLTAFLASDLARNITGQTLFVDAGFSILALPTV